MAEYNKLLSKSIPDWLSIPGIIAALTVFSYIFGSVYIERYYLYFGIPASALNFSAQDYMSHSFLPIISAVEIGIWVELFYSSVKKDLFFGFDLTKLRKIKKHLQAQGKQFGLKTIYRVDPQDMAQNLFMCGVSLAVAIFGFSQSSQLHSAPSSGTAIAVIFSIAIGISFFFGMQLVKILLPGYSHINISYLIPLVILLMIFYISVVGMMAKMQASSDGRNLPEVAITSKVELPIELQKSPETPKLSINLRVVVINSDRIYAISGDQSKAHEIGSPYSVYMIDYTSIQSIQYLVNQVE